MDIIPLLPLVGENHRQPLIHLSKRMVHIYTTDEQINKFAMLYG